MPRSAFRTDVALRSSPEVDARIRSIQRTLFKKPDFDLAEPQVLPATAPVLSLATIPTMPVQVTPSTPLPPIAPPPMPESPNLSGAVRELSAQPTSFTPYDRYLGNVRSVIAGIENRGASMGLTCSLMRQAHAFSYTAGDPYRAAEPSLTTATRQGDCKAKSLWLYDQLGDASALYVIGKAVAGAKNNHAWVYWRSGGRWWILDPTNRSVPIAADSVSPSRYVAYYSFGKAGAYRHKATRIFMAQDAPGITVVADRR